MIQSLDIQDRWIAEQIWYLQHMAYSVEAALVGIPEPPPLTDTIADLQQSDEQFYGQIIDDEIKAVLSCNQTKDTMTIVRLMVHPSYFRQGLASSLLKYAESKAINLGVRLFIVQTVEANKPAVSLYKSLGYKAYSELDTDYGIRLTEYRKAAPYR